MKKYISLFFVFVALLSFSTASHVYADDSTATSTDSSVTDTGSSDTATSTNSTPTDTGSSDTSTSTPSTPDSGDTSATSTPIDTGGSSSSTSTPSSTDSGSSSSASSLAFPISTHGVSGSGQVVDPEQHLAFLKAELISDLEQLIAILKAQLAATQG